MNYEYNYSPKCEKCGESYPESGVEIGQEFKCPICGESHILQREDILEIDFYITEIGLNELHFIEINHEKRKLIKPRRMCAVSKEIPSYYVNRKYEEIKRELENNPDWEGYSWGEYLTDEDTPTFE